MKKEREKTKKTYDNEIKRKKKELEDMRNLQTEKMKDGKSNKKQFLEFKGRERKRKRNRKPKTKNKKNNLSNKKRMQKRLKREQKKA